ncbi:MAG: hypothetical protein ACI4Q8_05155 [Ruminococcus sp.]
MNKAKRIIASVFLCTVIAVLNLVAVNAQGSFTTYELDEIGMSVAVPDDMLAVTRESEETDVFFTTFKSDYDSTMENLEKGNIYLQAMKTDNSAVLTISMTENEDSRNIENYNSLSEDQLDSIKKTLLTNESYKSCAIEKHNQNTYLDLYVKTKSDNKMVYAEQCNTVVDGKLYIITLQGSNGKKITADNKELMENILDSVTITPSNFFTENMDMIIFIGVIALSFVAVAVLFIIILKHFKNPVRKDKNLLHELAHEHRISATTQIPRKHFADVDYPEDNSFMDEYAPLGDGAVESAEQPNEEVVENIQVQPAENTPEVKVSEEVSEAVTSDESFENDSDYFDSVPEPEEMYSYTDVDNAVEDYSEAKRRARTQQNTEKTQKNSGNTAKKVFASIGKVLLNILQTIWVVLCFIIIHCKYFCINVYRLIKRKNAQRKRRKAEEERKRLQRERRQRQQTAEMNRHRQNQNRSDGELIKVRSSNQRVQRSGSYQRTRRANPGSTSHSSKRY